MKKLFITLLLTILFIPALNAAVTGTVTLYYNNGTVSYTDTQTFYEFDVQVYIDGGSGSNIFDDGMVYVEYNTTVFGSSVVSNGKVTSVTLMGPLAASGGALYGIDNTTDTYSNTFAVTFSAVQPYTDSGYDSDTYISNSSGSLSTILRIKMEVSASGSSNLDWPSSITDINNIYTEHDASNNVYEGLTVTNANETTSITYSNTGDPALPVTLASFAVEYENPGVAVKWTTESETENLGYVIKRAVRFGDSDLSAYEVIASYLNNDELLGAGTTVESNQYTYHDKTVKPGVSYSYILEDVDYNGVVTSHEAVEIVIPESYLVENADFKLGRNYPNPFNPSFTVPFELMSAMDVNIAMYDITGKQVMTIVNGYFEARQYQYRVDASDLNSGIYFVRTIIGNEVNTQKMTLLK